ncbi:MAG: hypothetical protein JNK97_14105 [Zoogloea sp.]|nr:hypothetical protein [Zoogloea sp.]
MSLSCWMASTALWGSSRIRWIVSSARAALMAAFGASGLVWSAI